VSVAGTTAAAEDGGAVGGDDTAGQTREALRRIVAAPEQVGASLEAVVRTRIFVTGISRWQEVGRAQGEVFADIHPAASMVEVGALIDQALLVEVEADAVVSVLPAQDPAANHQHAEEETLLTGVRARIDALDDQIVALLASRQRQVRARRDAQDRREGRGRPRPTSNSHAADAPAWPSPKGSIPRSSTASGPR